MWFTENPGQAVARITPAGVDDRVHRPDRERAAADDSSARATANLWVHRVLDDPATRARARSRSSRRLGFSREQHAVLAPPADNPLGLVDRGDGNIWYVATARAGSASRDQLRCRRRDQHSHPELRAVRNRDGTRQQPLLHRIRGRQDRPHRQLFSAQSEISLTTGTVPEQIVRDPMATCGSPKTARTRSGACPQLVLGHRRVPDAHGELATGRDRRRPRRRVVVHRERPRQDRPHHHRRPRSPNTPRRSPVSASGGSGLRPTVRCGSASPAPARTRAASESWCTEMRAQREGTFMGFRTGALAARSRSRAVLPAATAAAPPRRR